MPSCGEIMPNAITMEELFGPEDGDFKLYLAVKVYGIGGLNSETLDPPQHLDSLTAVVRWIDDHPDQTGYRKLQHGDLIWLKSHNGLETELTLDRQTLGR